MVLAEVIPSKKWNDLLRFWNYPRLANPVYSEELDEIAWFNFKDHQTRVNQKCLEEIIGKRHKSIILCHEIGHHVLIPHSQGKALVLINEAYKVLKDIDKAKTAENLFDDIIVNTFIAKKEEKKQRRLVKAYRSMLEYKSRTQPKGIEKLFDVYMRVYEILWDLPQPLMAHNAAFEQDARSIAHLLQNQMFNYNTWNAKVANFSRIINKYFEEDHNKKKTLSSRIKLTRQAVREAAREMPFRELKQLAGLLNLGASQEIVRDIYEGLADQYKIVFPRVKTISGEEEPFTPKTWTTEDPIERLDIYGTISKSGIFVPEITTQQWSYEKGTSFSVETGYPDLLIVLDTSGSMQNPNEDISYAHLSALVACNSALSLGSRVAVINFSTNVEKTSYTRDREVLYHPIFLYQKQCTEIPGTDILETTVSNANAQHILIITDAGIGNLATQKPLLAGALKKAGSGTLFLIGENESSNAEEFRSLGYKVVPMNSEADLLKNTIADMNEVYQ